MESQEGVLGETGRDLYEKMEGCIEAGECRTDKS